MPQRQCEIPAQQQPAIKTQLQQQQQKQKQIKKAARKSWRQLFERRGMGGRGGGWVAKDELPFDTSLKLTDVGWSGQDEVWAVTRRSIRTPVGKTNETNPNPNPKPKHKPDYRTWGVGRGVWARVLRMDFCIYARDAKETFTNEVVIGSCSFAAQPVQLLLFVPPPQLPAFPCCHNKLSDNCTNCQGGNAARDSSTVQRFQLSSTRCPACGLTVDALTD